jgi:broad specificity phosphatase PhoE
MRTLVLVRHGETVGNSRIRYFGRTDLELSELGRQQMRAAGRWLRRRCGAGGLARAISSPLRRATEGAAIIHSAITGATIIAPTIIGGDDRSTIEIEEFVEVDFGRFEGLTATEIEARFPADFARWNRDRLDPGFTYPGGESRAAFAERVERGIQRMLEVIDAPPVSRDGVALVVAHRGVIRQIVKRLGGVEPAIELGSIQILERENVSGAWRAEALDVIEHLTELE